MNDSEIILLVRSALAGMTNGPRNLVKSLDHVASLEDISLGVPEREIVTDALIDSDPNAGPRLIFERQLHAWDNVGETTWTDGTEPNTHERRALIHNRLNYGNDFAKQVDDKIPVYNIEEPTIIADEHEDWYTEERKQSRNFYWKGYESQLRKVNGWPEQSIRELDTATDRITSCLSDPERSEAFQSKGLVVGYVQSGKTANFTAVIAKAADAGYRLIIVLAGTLNILRDQTQRRLDKELIGLELLENDYQDEGDLDEFLKHGTRPSELGYFDWHRLTGPRYDYQSLKRGIDSLEFDRFDSTKPLYHTTNLHRIKARIVVIKKNGPIIRKLIRDLNRLRTKLEDVPTLIIDDESDQASINTRVPANRSRTAINELITQLLSLFPRGQYVGFTATPFANAFINPDDPINLFPKDFMICLNRPDTYMGLLDFIDLDDELTSFDSNETCFVRDVRGNDTSPENFQRALDSFVLAGAIKLFRSSKDSSLRYRHHTMLIHISRLQDDHAIDERNIREIYENSGFDSPTGIERLRILWEDDFVPVSQHRASNLPQPNSFGELQPFIGECVSRIDSGNGVLVVNGRSSDTPNFARIPVWKILVGGNKLSRGYTVEGLTVSYYRRAATAADTLMQMGRWFGFRRGYHDLVRLFIGRDAGTPRRPRDLYEDFRELFLMEEEFRSDLEKYSLQRQPRVLPRHIPPLVAAFLSIPPTAQNKMFNARVVGQNFGGQSSQPTVAPTNESDVKHNQLVMQTLLEGQEIHRARFECELANTDGENWSRFGSGVLVSSFDNSDLIEFLGNYRWLGDNSPVQRQIEFLEDRSGQINHGIRSWRLLAFQRATSIGEPLEINGFDFNVKSRSRTVTNRFQVYSEPKHVAIGQLLAGVESDLQVRNANNEILQLRDANVGTFLFYPVRKSGEANEEVTMGFALIFPRNDTRQRLWFSVRDPRNESAVTVPSDT